jgi:2-hydroxycyclohexanecarboxyl-CoA dehydrogenase
MVNKEITMIQLDNQIAVVTGAASGIGLATAETLAEAGAHVIISDIAEEKGVQAAEKIRNEGRKAEFIRLDVCDTNSINAFAKSVQDKHGAVDIIVNVAGWGRIEPFLENDLEFMEKVINVNLMGPMKLVKALLPAMVERKSGKIVNISSDAGRVGSLGEAVYSGAKGGVLAFSKALARETARHGITVNCICPGPTDTPLLQAVPERHREAFLRAIPMRRFAQPSDLADAVLFFASPRADYVTGQVISVSGGLTMVG